LQKLDKRSVCFLSENVPDRIISVFLVVGKRWLHRIVISYNSTNLRFEKDRIVKTWGREERGVEIALLKQVYWRGGVDN
jgi:hypothetical protein